MARSLPNLLRKLSNALFPQRRREIERDGQIARILDLQNRVGSLEPGKDADLILLSGDPLSVYTKVLQTWVEGRKVFDRDNAQDRIYQTGGVGAAHDARYPSEVEEY